MKMKTRMKVLPALLLAGGLMMMPPAAQAEPITASIAEALMYYVGYDTAGLIASAIVSTAVSAAYSYVSAAMTKSNAGSAASQMAARTQMIRSPIAPRTKVYGRVQTSGPLLFVGVSDVKDGLNSATGNVVANGKNGFLHMIVALAAHEIDAVEEIYLNDQQLNVYSMQAGQVRDGYYGGTDSNYHVGQSLVIPANNTVLNFNTYPCATMIGLVEVGTSAANTPGGGEGGVDGFGRPLLPNGGTAAIDIPVTVSPDGTTGTIAAVNRSRTCYLTYIAKPVARSRVLVNVHLGTPGQAADSLLMQHMPDKWTANHKLSGIAYLYIRLQYDPKLFTSGIPNVKALIRGAKVHDPRNGAYPGDVPVYSNNYALCVLDYLKSPNGLNCADSDIDLPSVIASANSCDEPVLIQQNGVNGATVTLYQNRYTCDGVVTLDTDPEQNLRNLSTAGGGPVPLLVGGLFRIPVGVWSTPTARGLTASDLRGPVKMTPHAARRDLFNAVSGTFIEGVTTWQATSFPTVKNSTYQASDGGEQIIRDITLPFTVDVIRAQRLAKILIERSRLATIVQWPGKPACFAYSVGDVVPVTLAKFGWTNKNFRVIGWSMNENSSVDLTLQEDASTVYDWAMGSETPVDYSLNTGLPPANYVEPMGALTLYSDASELILAGDGTVISRLHVIWPAVKDASVAATGEIQVQYKKASESYWTPYDKIGGSVTETWISPVVDTEIYYVRVRSVNGRGIPSDWVYGKHTIIGNTAPPPNVSNFTVSVRADGTRSFAWTTNDQPINVTNGGGYRIKYRDGNSNGAWSTMTPLHNGLLSQSPLQIADPVAGFYDFGIVAVNGNRVESSTPAMVNDATIGKEPVTYAASANLLFNSDWQLSNGKTTGRDCLYGWFFNVGTMTGGTPDTVGRNYPLINPGRGGAYIRNDASYIGTNHYEYLTQAVTVSAGASYEISVLVLAQRCATMLRVDWYNGSNQLISGSAPQTYDAGSTTNFSGASFDGMRQLWAVVTAPAGATYCLFSLYKYGTNSGNSDSYVFWNRAMMCVARPGVTAATATPWIEAGADQLHGGSLAGSSVDSAQVAAEAATSVRTYDQGAIGSCGLNPSSPTGINVAGFTAPVACTVTVYCRVHYSSLNSQSGSPGSAVVYENFALGISTGGYAYDGTSAGKFYIEQPSAVPGEAVHRNVTVSRTFSMTPGQNLVFYLFGSGGVSYTAGGSGSTSMYVYDSTIRLEAIKR